MSSLPPSNIPIFTTVSSYRQWRREAFLANKSVGFVPTMGALHDGHLSLVRRSLAENDLTVLSIFVNPAQFAPHEDLATYPRTLPQDLDVLSAQRDPQSNRSPSAVFLPSVQEMYPSGISQVVSEQRGTFVEVKGLAEEMEGKSRPTFFRGVATAVTKLFNAIEPTSAYFGQKDIQQAILLRRMVSDLLVSHPSPDNLHIVPTARDPSTGLALSSRNAYLSKAGLDVAPTLYQALCRARQAWDEGKPKAECIDLAKEIIRARKDEVKEDYIEMNDAHTLTVLPNDATRDSLAKTAIVSGAMWVDKTRLIDNLVLGNVNEIIY
ncbi:pantothenate synthase [Moniliophthora roreri]|nr:pantothenate synthase [Moniliophthora roreri]